MTRLIKIEKEVLRLENWDSLQIVEGKHSPKLEFEFSDGSCHSTRILNDDFDLNALLIDIANDLMSVIDVEIYVK